MMCTTSKRVLMAASVVLAFVWGLNGCATKEERVEYSRQAPSGSPPGAPEIAFKAGMPMPGAPEAGVEGKVAVDEASGSTEGKAYAAPAPANVNRKVIMTGNVTLEIKNFEKSHAAVVKIAKQLNGYVANSQLNLPTEGAQSGTITIRVPQEKYEEALDHVKGLGKVVTESQTAEDVTQKYVDLEARVRNLKAEEERILDIMKRARTIKETLQVDERLTAIREKIEVIEGQFRYLKFQISMATITVTLAEKATVLHLREPKWVWLNHVKSAWHGVVEVAQTLTTVVTYLVVFGVFWAPLLIIVLVIGRVRRRKSERP